MTKQFSDHVFTFDTVSADSLSPIRKGGRWRTTSPNSSSPRSHLLQIDHDHYKDRNLWVSVADYSVLEHSDSLQNLVVYCYYIKCCIIIRVRVLPSILFFLKDGGPSTRCFSSIIFGLKRNIHPLRGSVGVPRSLPIISCLGRSQNDIR